MSTRCRLSNDKRRIKLEKVMCSRRVWRSLAPTAQEPVADIILWAEPFCHVTTSEAQLSTFSKRHRSFSLPA